MSGGKNTLFRKDPVEFMKKYAVTPADNIEAEIGGKESVMAGTGGGDRSDYVYSTMQNHRRIAWLDFAKKKRGAGFDPRLINQGEGGIVLTGSYVENAKKVKSYFLPWVEGGIINLAIPPLGAADADPTCNFFFTATITGCSIFIKGTRQAPVIYHAGGSTHQANPDLAAAYWRNLMNIHSGAGVVVGEVNKTNYVSETGFGSNSAPATSHSTDFTNWMKSNATSSFEVDYTFPWGCVMGIRDGNGDWTFYLQENCSIFYYKFSKANWYSLKKTVKSSVMVASRPLLFREFFPTGLAHVNYQPMMPKKRL